ncbi:MAG TPA: glutaredoxin domain-containing protein [Candidatus Angelobacter sp.]|nr:glutaredoxin domain-containing protein [Candidatus Angelobacter sp.]
MLDVELFGTTSCPYTQEMREWLEWRKVPFVEYDIERDQAARERLREAAAGQTMIPILLEDGKVVQAGWQGRGCAVNWK